MRRSYPLFAAALLSFQCTGGAEPVRKHVKAHEQQLQALVKEWLRDGPYQLTHGTLNVPAAGTSGWNLRVKDGWLIVPRRDFRTRMDDATWFWPAEGSSWWVQNERNVDVAANGRNTYRRAARASTLEQLESYAKIPGGRLESWMKAVKQLRVRSISLDPAWNPPHSPTSVTLTFEGSDREGVFFRPFGSTTGGERTTVQHLWGPWYYFKRQSAANPP